MERLQKVIANSGYCSRRKAEELIVSGRVKVDGEVINILGYKVPLHSVVSVDDVTLGNEDKVYYLLNKPRGVITSVSDDKNRKTVVDLIDTDKRIYPIGRLDYDTTGVLLLTNDGEFANIMMHPSNNIEKVYVAKVRGIIKGEEINKLKNGVLIDGVMTSKARVKLRKYDKDSNTSLVEVTIHEGRNHQIKKMFESVGFDVIRLNRKRVGIITTLGLRSGEYRALTPKEIKILYSLIK